jgi:hypothetical protein
MLLVIMRRKIVLYELNEVPWRVLDQFAAWRPTSHLARLLPVMRRLGTFAEDRSDLSPWITWPTLHRGVTDERHGILSFGQDLTTVDREYPPIWKLLARAGVSVGVCGSLHTYPLPPAVERYRFFIPDAFATGAECFPVAISTFQAFNLDMARKSARNVSRRIPWARALRFLAAAPALGLKPRTAIDVARQLASERRRPWQRVRWRTYQTVLEFDIFMHQLETTRPDFSTFFTNHVASSMHRYWAATFPTDYEEFDYTDEWVDTYRGEIAWTMEKADELFGRLVRFAERNPEYQIWVTTSMGQAATEAKPVATQLYIGDVRRFMTALGFAPTDWSQRPAMLPEYSFRLAPHRFAAFRDTIAALRIAGRPIRYTEAGHDFVMISLRHKNLTGVNTVQVGERVLSFEALGLSNTPIEDMSGPSAYHIPQGCLVIYDPQDRAPKVGRAEISTCELAPTLLERFGAPRPDYMRKPVALG